MDAKSVFDSATAKVVAPPAEKHLVLCLLKLREFLDRHLVAKLWWVDTLMMVSDGLTKGAIKRDDIERLCHKGLWIHAGKTPVSWTAAKTQGL